MQYPIISKKKVQCEEEKCNQSGRDGYGYFNRTPLSLSLFTFSVIRKEPALN